MTTYYYVYGPFSSDINQSSHELLERNPSSKTSTIPLCL